MSFFDGLGTGMLDAVKLAFMLVKNIGKSLSNLESDPSIKGMMQLTFLVFTPLILIGAALLFVLWFLLQKAVRQCRRDQGLCGQPCG